MFGALGALNMHYAISFETEIFDLESEKINSINPIKGYSVGNWFKPHLESAKITVSEIDEEDWGWYSIAKYKDGSYLIGFIALPDEKGIEPPEIIVQVDRVRSFWKKLLGKDTIQASDEICKIIKKIIDDCKDFNKIEVVNGA